jgi:CO/xanthine dehydrogenase Mo-binding subunit
MMTGLPSEREFSRRSLIRGGGALVVGFSVVGAGLGGRAQAGLSPYASVPIDQYQVDAWITVNADNTAAIRTGGILQGTGSDTGLMMIAAEELNMEMSQLQFVNSDTAITPDSGKHSASNTIKNAGPGVRAAAATAAQTLLGLASTQLGVPASSLSVSKGVVSVGGKSVSYGQLLGGKLFNVAMPASWNMAPVQPATPNAGGFSGGIQPGQSPAKAISAYTIVGTDVPRIDVPDIVTGKTTYIQNIRVPGMLHGRVVRPRGQMLFGFGVPIVSVDESSIAHLPSVKIVRVGDFIGVVAPHEFDAIQAAAQLKVKWADPPPTLPGSGNEFQGLRKLDSAGKSVQSFRTLTGNVDAALTSAAKVVNATYGWPTNSHTPIGPMCAVADVTPQGTRIFSGTQGVYSTRGQVALILGVPLNQVRVTAAAMGGCFGDGCQYHDVAQAAALMSRAVGAPVRVQLMRWDEISWDSTSPPSLIDVRAGVDSKGNLVAMDYAHFYPQYRDDTINTNAQLVGLPLPVPASTLAGIQLPTVMYNIPNNRYLAKSIPLQGNWIKAHWMRAGSGPHTTFAGEQVIDELAHAAGIDPVAFRIQNVVQGNDITQSQARDPLLAVLNAVTQAANWQPRVAASSLSEAGVVTGRGVAWSNADNPATYAQTAAIADINVNKKTGKITVQQVWQAVSAGLSVSIGGIENQIVGGVTQVLSRMLVERYAYTPTHVTSTDFVTYPILRFKDAPKVTPIVVQWSSRPFTAGVGEPVAMAAAAAVANAFFDATGVRMRTAPFTTARVRAYLKEAAA